MTTASGGTGGSGGSTGASGGTGGGTGGTAALGGSGGAPPNAPACLNVDPYTGGVALADDFSMNSETGRADEHTLAMNRGAMIRRQLDYQTTGDDHTHSIVFTDEQLAALLRGETVVVHTDGPPLDASSGHSHTVTVHPCLSPS
jgi:hypothetical protein